MCIRVGITGDMGSGKTWISMLFEQKGVPVYNCDENSKRLISTLPELITEIKTEFGENMYEGNLFKNLAAIVFVDEARLEKLTSIIRPYINNDIESFFTKHSEEKFALIETATLYEVGMNKILDRVIYVHADEKVRMERAKTRSGTTEEDYRNRMKNQINSVKKIRMSDYTISNGPDDDPIELVEQVYEHLTTMDPEKYVAKKWLDEHFNKYFTD